MSNVVIHQWIQRALYMLGTSNESVPEMAIDGYFRTKDKQSSIFKGSKLHQGTTSSKMS